MSCFSKRAVSVFRSFLLIVIAFGFVALIQNASQAATLGIMNFAAASNGGTAVSVGGNAQTPGGAIDGVIPGASSTLNSATWPGAGGVAGAIWTGTLGPEGPEGSVSEIRVYDRGCCASIAPYTIELLDATNAVIFSDSLVSNSPQLRPATFNVPNLVGAAKVRLTHDGPGTGDAYLHEVEVIGLNNHVGGANNIGSESLQSTISGPSSPGNLSNARVVQLTLTSSVGAERADISEFRVLDTGSTNVALAGSGFHRAGGPGTNDITTAGDGPNLNDNNTATFSDQVGGLGDFYGITLAANTTIDAIETVNRGDCCSPGRDMRRQVFSDTARTNLIYDDEVSFSGINGDTILHAFEFGGVASAAMDDGQTYIFELDADLNTSDMLVVPQLQADSTSLVFDGELVVQLLNGIPEVGDSFQLFDADSFSGEFNSITLPVLPGTLEWSLGGLFVNGSISVGAVPEPSTFALMGLLGLGMITRLRRRQKA